MMSMGTGTYIHTVSTDLRATLWTFTRKERIDK